MISLNSVSPPFRRRMFGRGFARFAAAAALALIVCAAPAEGADSGYRFKGSFGRSGKGPGQFDHPLGVAVDAAGHIYVTDWGNKRVQIFRSDGSYSREFDVRARLSGRGAKGKGPTGIALEPGGDILVADQDADTVKRFDRTGAPVAQIGRRGSWLERLKEPRGVAVDRFDRLYVADHENYRVQKFALGGDEGHDGKGKAPRVAGAGDYLSEVKYKDVVLQQFAKPRGVAVDREGNLLTVYSDIARVVAYDREGRVLREYGGRGTGPVEFGEPRYVAVDNLGNVYVTDFTRSRVIKLDPRLEPLEAFGEGPGDDGLLYPEGIAVDASGNVYVADSGKNRVAVFEPPERIKRLNYAYLYAHKGDYEAASREYEEAWRIDPEAPGVKESLVDALVRAGGRASRAEDRAGAVKFFRRALEFDPLNAYAIRELKDLEALPAAVRKSSLRNILVGSLVALAVFLSFMMAVGYGEKEEEPAEEE